MKRLILDGSASFALVVVQRLNKSRQRNCKDEGEVKGRSFDENKGGHLDKPADFNLPSPHSGL